VELAGFRSLSRITTAAMIRIRQAKWLATALALAALTAGCFDDTPPPGSVGTKTGSKSGGQPLAIVAKLDVVGALDRAVKKLSETYSLKKPYTLNASVSKEGEWVFTFSFLPLRPGNDVYVIVGTNDVSVVPGL
jgi:hypothetical protein